MRTRDVAARAGVNVQTLRYYERRGLLAKPPRTPAGYRDYPAAAIRVLRFVKRSKELGFTLTEIEQLQALAEGGPDSCARARALAVAQVTQLDRKIADLQRMRSSLAELVATCERPKADRSCPLLESLEATASLTT